MATQQMTRPWTLHIAPSMIERLERHLFPGDGDEHGAVIGASVLRTKRGTRLLANQLFLALDDTDYIPGKYGYRMLTADFVAQSVLRCAHLGLAYLAIHCHGGRDRVSFSSDDLASHERGYPALLDILDGPPVGALVFAHNAVAGSIWLPNRSQVPLDHVVVPGRPIRTLHPSPRPRPSGVNERYDRQARLLGDRGVALLRGQKVGVIGAGGAGSLIIEYLSRLGVGELVVVDPDRIEPSNLSRVVGARRRDTRPILTNDQMPSVIQDIGKRLRRSKVSIAKRVASEAQPGINFAGLRADVTFPDVARHLIDCDYVFLAADTMQARLLFNSIVHQYLIPGIQVGAKAQIDQQSGEVLDLFVAVRPLVPGATCLWCNELISSSKLQEEATDPDQRRRQRYVDEHEVSAPSVITLNAIAAADATNEYLLALSDLLAPGPTVWTKVFPMTGQRVQEVPRVDPDCIHCSSELGSLGAGDTKRLPVRQATKS